MGIWPRLRHGTNSSVLVWGTGHEFLDEVISAFRAIAQRPLQYPVVRRDTRRALMPRFPFGIYFRVENPNIVVVAVIHGSRHPDCWQRRT